MKNSLLTTIAVLAGAVILTAPSASAVSATYDVLVQKYTTFQPVQVTYGAYQATSAGVFKGTIGKQAPFAFLCTDLGANLSPTETVKYEFMDLVEAAAEKGVNPDWVAGGIQYAAYLVQKNLNAVKTDNVKGAALQVAVWEVLYDTGLSLSGGLVKATSSVAGLISVAQGYLDSLVDVDVSDAQAAWLHPNPETQNRRLKQGGLTTVPDAGSTVMILGMGMLALEGLRRKLA